MAKEKIKTNDLTTSLLLSISTVIKQTKDNREKIKNDKERLLEDTTIKANELILAQIALAVKAGLGECSEYLGDIEVAEILKKRYSLEKYEAVYSSFTGHMRLKWSD